MIVSGNFVEKVTGNRDLEVEGTNNETYKGVRNITVSGNHTEDI